MVDPWTIAVKLATPSPAPRDCAPAARERTGPQLRIVTGQDGDQQRRIGGARLPDGQCRSRDATFGICGESRESIPCRQVEGTGTASTGTMVLAASIPGKCAAPPAAAMMIFSPRGSACSA